MAILTKYILKYKLNDNETLLINSMNSALDIVDDETKKKIEMMEKGIQNIDKYKDKELFKNLVDRGYIYEKKEDEQKSINSLREVHEEVIKFRTTTSFTICPTMGCNLRCTYCFESEDQHKDYTLMSEGQLESIFEYISNSLQDNQKYLERINKNLLSKPSISLFGGEPLLKKSYKIVKKIFEFAYEKKLGVKIITNGTTVQIYKGLLKKYKDIIQVQVTIDGEKKIHDERRIYANGKGSFDEISKNIDTILNIGIPIHLRINIDQKNIHSLYKLDEYMKVKGWDENKLLVPYASPVLDFCGSGGSDILSEHQLLALLFSKGYYGKKDSFINHVVAPSIGYVNMFFNSEKKMKPWKTDYCEAVNKSSFIFSPNGKIATCLTYCDKGDNYIGEFDENGVRIDLNKYKLWNERNIFRLNDCKDCKYGFMCGGGCPVAAIEQNNSIDQVVCSDIAKTLETYLEIFKDDLLKGWNT